MAATLCPAMLRVAKCGNFVARHADNEMFLRGLPEKFLGNIFFVTLRKWQNESTFRKHDHVSSVAAAMRPRVLPRPYAIHLCVGIMWFILRKAPFTQENWYDSDIIFTRQFYACSGQVKFGTATSFTRRNVYEPNHFFFQYAYHFYRNRTKSIR